MLKLKTYLNGIFQMVKHRKKRTFLEGSHVEK